MTTEGINPYESPRCAEPEPGVLDQMDALRKEFENRFGQLAADAFMGVEFTAACGMVAWRISEDPAYTAAAASVPAIFFAVESVRDLIHKTRAFPGRMADLRRRSADEWTGVAGNGSRQG